MQPVFADKRALVVGGTGGIGRFVALGLAARGAAVTITGGSSPKRLEAVLAELDAGSGTIPEKTKHSGFLCRIGSPDGLSPEKAAAFILETATLQRSETGEGSPPGTPAERATASEGSPPDILVLAWGPFKRIPLEETTPGDWRFFVENNLMFPGIMVSSVLCGMIKRGWGRILLFGGTKTADIRGFSTAAYAAAKTALGVLAKSAAKSARKAGITCNVICPGLTDTEYTDSESRAYNREKSPGRKVLEAEEIAHIALAVLENPAVNGAIIPADRGLWV
jgi:NAD(P)-dependent dehydrogenase (short-subunit alcohol dehydrogenase family)